MTLFHPPRPLSGSRLPPLRVGLLGGSFDPAHDGHKLVAQRAMQRLNLHAVWWLLAPENPLKPASKTPYDVRLAELSAFIAHPRMAASGIERDMGTYRTLHTVRALKKRFPQIEFVFLAGMDSADTLPRWHKWRALLRELPIVFVNRPPQRFGSQRLRLMNQNGITRTVKNPRAALAQGKNAIIFLDGGPTVAVSSSALRKEKHGLFGLYDRLKEPNN